MHATYNNTVPYIHCCQQVSKFYWHIDIQCIYYRWQHNLFRDLLDHLVCQPCAHDCSNHAVNSPQMRLWWHVHSRLLVVLLSWRTTKRLGRIPYNRVFRGIVLTSLEAEHLVAGTFWCAYITAVVHVCWCCDLLIVINNKTVHQVLLSANGVALAIVLHPRAATNSLTSLL